MSVRTKRRRKIICDNKQYVWYVKDDYDYGILVLNIISYDKKIILSYPLGTPLPYLVSKGKVFQNCVSDGKWKRYLTPFKEAIITPKFVSALIFWATKGKNAVQIDWNGKNILL